MLFWLVVNLSFSYRFSKGSQMSSHFGKSASSSQQASPSSGLPVGQDDLSGSDPVGNQVPDERPSAHLTGRKNGSQEVSTRSVLMQARVPAELSEQIKNLLKGGENETTADFLREAIEHLVSRRMLTKPSMSREPTLKDLASELAAVRRQVDLMQANSRVAFVTVEHIAVAVGIDVGTL